MGSTDDITPNKRPRPGQGDRPQRPQRSSRAPRPPVPRPSAGPARKRAKRRPSRGFSAVQIGIAAIGLCLVAVGFVRGTAGALAMGTWDARAQIREGQSLPAGALAEAEEGLARSLSLWPFDALSHDDRGLFLELQGAAAAARGAPSEAQALYTAAEAAYGDALSYAPSQPMVWLRLAAVRERLDRPSAEIIPAFEASLAFGPYHPDAVLERAYWTSRLCTELPADSISASLEAIRLAYAEPRARRQIVYAFMTAGPSACMRDFIRSLPGEQRSSFVAYMRRYLWEQRQAG